MDRIRIFCKALPAFLTVAIVPLLLMGCGNDGEKSDYENGGEYGNNDDSGAGESTYIDEGINESVNDDIDELILYIKEHGIFACPVPAAFRLPAP